METIESLENVKLPAFVRDQLVTQFRTHLRDIEQKLSQEEHFSLQQLLHVFSVLDTTIGKHWPLLATSLWKPRSQVLASAYFNTSQSMLNALANLMKGNTAFLPFVNVSYDLTSKGMDIKVRPRYDVGPRNWHIVHTLLILGMAAIYQDIAPEEAKGIVFNTSVPDDEAAAVFRNLVDVQINFGIPLKDTYAFYPTEFLQVRPDGPNEFLNDLLLQEILKQSEADGCGDFLARAREVMTTLPYTEIKIGIVAEQLRLSNSTLYRRLLEHDTSFDELKNAVIRERVLIALQKFLSPEDIASVVGFSSTRSLNEFSRRQFSCSIGKMIRGKAPSAIGASIASASAPKQGGARHV